MGIQSKHTVLTNWSLSAYSECLVRPVARTGDLLQALASARAQHLNVIPHGAGHSYTDAALNTRGMVLDLTPMNRILSWDAACGILRAEPGVTLREVVRTAGADGWWPFVSPSTPEVTLGGCAAMNVNGRNAWKVGPFGAHLLALEVLFPSGEECTLTPEHDGALFRALVGSMGLLGVITSVTLQLQRLGSGYVTVRRRPADTLAESFALLAEEETGSDFMEAWFDGFASGDRLGRGQVTSASLEEDRRVEPHPLPGQAWYDRLAIPLARLAAGLARPALLPGMKAANRLNIWLGRQGGRPGGNRRALFPYTYWPAAAISGYYALLPEGVETFQAFLPGQCAEEMTERLLRYTQKQGFIPLWCVIKRHAPDPFLLSYQVDGFSLELNYPRTRRTAADLERVLRSMIAETIEAGGRFYLAKDHFLTGAQYRRSLGNEAVDTFLSLKQRVDPEAVLQSDLFRRIFLT
jgi:FAD/FMN-containing dehydrogenase